MVWDPLHGHTLILYQPYNLQGHLAILWTGLEEILLPAMHPLPPYWGITSGLELDFLLALPFAFIHHFLGTPRIELEQTGSP